MGKSVFGTLAMICALVAPQVFATPDAAGCPSGAHIIAVRGHPKNASKPTQGFGITKPLLRAIKKGIPGSDAQPINYPKGGTLSSENSAATKNEQDAIAAYIKKCPKTPVVLMGYSEGATITMNTVCGSDGLRFSKTPTLSEKYKKNIIAIVVYSDGTHLPFQSYDKGTCPDLPGTYPRLNPSACDPYADLIQSYCDMLDNYCCTAGKSHPYHYQYFKKYDNDVTTFIEGQYKKWKSGSLN